MHAVHLPVLAGALLVVVSGLNKIWRPAPTVRALRTLAAAIATPGAVRALGAVEVGTGLVVLGAPWRGAALALGLLYAGFTAFVLVALATGAPLQSCGCFGAADAPPSVRHVVLDAAVAAVAIAAATDASLGPACDTLTAARGGGAVLAVALAVAGWWVLRGPRALSPR